MWRPEKWKETHHREYRNAHEAGRIAGLQMNTLIDTFEAGADAILEALLESNEPSCEVFETTVTCMDRRESGPVKVYGKPFKGKTVFIPEEGGI